MTLQLSAWNLVEADPHLTGVLVLVFAVLAVVYVGRRLWRKRRRPTEKRRG